VRPLVLGAGKKMPVSAAQIRHTSHLKCRVRLSLKPRPLSGLGTRLSAAASIIISDPLPNTVHALNLKCNSATSSISMVAGVLTSLQLPPV